ncbi:2-dehydro-3-deoxyphosphogalactonate aldolase [Novosphingobium chloroacetimidivorans]|uniref:2-dehydro-3-deoxyphosphogalactonate aldolase n=1 Tax=Novosphingobium chloroacetimidivorans TaxID=1428314 RepID=A0A7W7KEJ2_9SPHN|nr:2-dehydro-3-deoxy-6-phosphogalactonate aldolase [Novosphingobium chloroacetimidivorans]MBB4860799.1 2-dehydro-3-deoxyphosphogalactonate aldolase [Novosphingobium chloroacetimidivorans]
MTDPARHFQQAFAACPLVAVLRGVTPAEIDGVGDALVAAGMTILEVPLNSPDPYDSIAKLAERHGHHALIGAGTVVTPEDVARVRQAGGHLVVSPNTDVDVIRATVGAGMVSLPGYYTPSEGFEALQAGAHGLKLFPCEGADPAYLRAQRAVLPRHVPVLAVGGMTVEAMPAWRAAGADGFGLGSNLYRAAKPIPEVAAAALAFVAAVHAL